MNKKVVYSILALSIAMNIVLICYIGQVIRKQDNETSTASQEQTEDYFNYFLMDNPIDQYFKEVFQDDALSEIDRRDYQEFYLKIWQQEYNTIMDIIKAKCQYKEDRTRYQDFTDEITSSYDTIQPLLLAEMLDNYTMPESPEKYSYGNGTHSMLDMYQGMIYRNACMFFIQYLQDEYTFPTHDELDNFYNSRRTQ